MLNSYPTSTDKYLVSAFTDKVKKSKTYIVHPQFILASYE